MLKSIIKSIIAVSLIGFILIFIFMVFHSYHEIGYHSRTSPANACINHLRQIDAAASQFALEHHLTNGAPINFPNDLIPYLYPDKNRKSPSCPSGGVYHLSKVGQTPTCSLGTTVTPPHVLQ
jgi:hypothetical protein